MKICITIPTETKTWFMNMYNLIINSLKDLGYFTTSLTEADIIISIQYFPNEIQKIEGKKYILLQVEQRSNPNVDITCYYKFADKIWSFDIDNKREEYLVLGYHPSLEFKNNVNKDIKVGFFGCETTRRISFKKRVRNKYNNISLWDFNTKLRNIKRSIINLNLHSYGSTTYTEWDRICLILANKSFLLSESFYCPLKVEQFKDEKEYDDKVNYFLNHNKEREEISLKLYEEYRIKYDMRKILEEKLKCI